MTTFSLIAMSSHFGSSTQQPEAGKAPSLADEEAVKNDNIDEDLFEVGYCYSPSYQLKNLCSKLESNEIYAIDTAGLTMDVDCCKLLAVALWKNKSLQFVSIENQGPISDQAVEILCKGLQHHCDKLNTLSFCVESLSQESLRKIVTAVGSVKQLFCRVLSARTNTFDLSPVVKAISSKLERLTLYCTHRLGTDESVDELLNAAKTCPNLLSLHIRNFPLDQKSLAALKSLLETTSSLRTLSLINGDVCGKALKILESSLIDHPTLCELVLEDDHRSLQRWAASDSGVTVVANVLKSPATKLTRLSLHHTAVGENGAVLMANALRRNTTLVHLDLRRTGIRQSGLVALGNAISHNRTLEKLWLLNALKERTPPSKEGLQAWVDGLRENTTLTSIQEYGGNAVFWVKRDEDVVNLFNQVRSLVLRNSSQDCREVKAENLQELVENTNSIRCGRPRLPRRLMDTKAAAKGKSSEMRNAYTAVQQDQE